MTWGRLAGREYAPGLAHDPPASTVCQVVSLSKENMLVEFDMIALRG
jgi:enamine deaminase RidA (YjgF/YER057c/UK114 family)